MGGCLNVTSHLPRALMVRLLGLAQPTIAHASESWGPGGR